MGLQVPNCSALILLVLFTAATASPTRLTSGMWEKQKDVDKKKLWTYRSANRERDDKYSLVQFVNFGVPQNESFFPLIFFFEWCFTTKTTMRLSLSTHHPYQCTAERMWAIKSRVVMGESKREGFLGLKWAAAWLSVRNEEAVKCFLETLSAERASICQFIRRLMKLIHAPLLRLRDLRGFCKTNCEDMNEKKIRIININDLICWKETLLKKCIFTFSTSATAFALQNLF